MCFKAPVPVTQAAKTSLNLSVVEGGEDWLVTLHRTPPLTPHTTSYHQYHHCSPLFTGQTSCYTIHEGATPLAKSLHYSGTTTAGTIGPSCVPFVYAHCLLPLPPTEVGGAGSTAVCMHTLSVAYNMHVCVHVYRTSTAGTIGPSCVPL